MVGTANGQNGGSSEPTATSNGLEHYGTRDDHGLYDANLGDADDVIGRRDNL